MDSNWMEIFITILYIYIYCIERKGNSATDDEKK